MKSKIFFQKIQGLKDFHKKLIVFGLIMVLAVLLGFLVIKNFQKNLKRFNKEDFLKELNLPKAQEETKNSFDEIDGLKEQIKQEIEEFTTSTSPSNVE